MDYHSSGPNSMLAQSKNQISHSLSTPSNMDSPGGVSHQEHSLPENKKQPSKMFSVQVHFLDGTIGNVQIQYKAMGKLLFEQVCKMLNLLEVDYFGLEYSDDAGVKYWLDYEKPMCRQLGLSMVHPVMYFSIKFYTPDPAQLEEEYTRYLFSLQIKKDLTQGLLQCNENTAALMASYIVQSECGDYNTEDYPDHTYLSSYKFVPNQDAEFQRKIMENHKKHVGQTPSEADLNLLETARRCELYGIRMTPAKDNEGVPLNLATAHMGVLVFQNFTKINTFSWAKIRKLSFKRKRFLIKLHPEGYGFYKDSVEFNFESRNECKNFWKKCIENHAFFRCAEVKKVPRQKTRIFSRGSSFRYSGRTQKQIVEFVRENYIKRQPFQRSTSLRIPSSSRSGVGTSISAQPLLPVSGSQSCGSVIISNENTSSSNRPSSPSQSPPRPPPHQHANSVSQPVSPTHHRLTNGGGSIANERESPRTVANGFGNAIIGHSRGGAKSDGEDDTLPTGLKPSDLENSFDDGLKSPNSLGHEGDDNVSHDSYLVDEKDVTACSDIAVMKDFSSDTTADFTESVLKAVSAKAETLVSERVGVETSTTESSDKSSDLAESVIERKPSLVVEKSKGPISQLKKSLDDNCTWTEEVGETKIIAKKGGSLKSQKNGKGGNGKRADIVPTTAKGNVKNGNGEIEYILHKRLLTTSSSGNAQERSKKRKPRVRVEMERPRTAHGSPTLYARASRITSSFSMGDELSGTNGKVKARRGSSTSPKGHRLRTVDYVSLHQLPNMRSFSSQDDSLEDDSFERDLFEQFRRRRLSQGSTIEKKELKIHQSKSDDSILKSSCADFPYIDAVDDDTSKVDEVIYNGSRMFPETIKAGFNISEAVQPVPDSYDAFGDFPRASSPVGFDAQDEGIECELDGIIFISDSADPLGSSENVLPDILPSLLLPPPSPPLAFKTRDSTPDIYEDYVSQKHSSPLCSPATCPHSSSPPLPPSLLSDNSSVISKLKSQKCVEDDLSQTSSSEGTFSQCSTSSDQMHQLSDAQLFETHLILSQEDLATLEDDFPLDDQPEITHTEEIYITLNTRSNGEERPVARYSYSAYKFNSFEDGSTTTEGETICDDTSLNGQMEILEHITEQLEKSYSDDETAVVGEDPSTESLPTTPRSTRSHRSYLELEVVGGAILERTSSFSHGSPSHSTTQN